MPDPHPRPEVAVERLQALIRIPTVSGGEQRDAAAFDRFLDELARLFPLLHERLEWTRVAEHGLLFRWPGRAGDRPVVLMAHLDVVPVDYDATWTHPPFAGVVADGIAYGRGTLDDKGSLAAICEAVEQHLAAGFVPAQDVWLSFGCDEEISGVAAPEAVAVLRERGVRPWFIVDEGGAVAAEAFPGVRRPVAVIGVTEKGTTGIELTVEGRGGHASTPARNGPTARLARAITRIDKAPFPASLPAPTLELLSRMAPHLPPGLRQLMSRADSLGPLLTRALIAAGPESAAMTRTTIAVTTLSGSPAHNVIASTAKAGLNVRVMLGDTVADVVEHLRRVIGDKQVRIDVTDPGEASPLSPYDDEAFALLTETTEAVFPDAIVSPYVVMAATDSRFFTAICERVYRFAPFRMSKAQRESIHSYDEQLGVEDYLDGIRWYHRLIERIA